MADTPLQVAGGTERPEARVTVGNVLADAIKNTVLNVQRSIRAASFGTPAGINEILNPRVFCLGLRFGFQFPRTGRGGTPMTETTLDEVRLKQLLKTAILEVLEERKDFLREVIEETLEDIALARAIEVGQGTREVSRNEVFSGLEGGR